MQSIEWVEWECLEKIRSNMPNWTLTPPVAKTINSHCQLSHQWIRGRRGVLRFFDFRFDQFKVTPLPPTPTEKWKLFMKNLRKDFLDFWFDHLRGTVRLSGCGWVWRGVERTPLEPQKRVVRILLECFLAQVLQCKTCYRMYLSLQELMTLCETSSQIFCVIYWNIR